MPMKILVTGADGFIGSHLTEKLVESGHSVKALCMYNSLGSRGWLDTISRSNEIESIFGDIRDQNFIKSATKNVDLIFNLAALISIPYSYLAPRSYFETNVLGTLNICNSVLENNVGKLIQISTSEVYGSAIYTPIDESHPLQAQSPYSASKISSDAVAFSYLKTFELPLIIARPFNVFGPRQSIRALIPSIIIQIIRKSNVVEVGNLSSIRDYTFVSDTINGLIKLIDVEQTLNPTFNIGTGVGVTGNDLFEIIAKITDYSGTVKVTESRHRPENSEVDKLICNFDKIHRTTNFKPEIDLETGLIRTIEWFKENSRRYPDINIYS